MRFGAFAATALLVACALSAAPASARPITYLDGVRVLLGAEPSRREASIAYSVSSGSAFGFDSVWHDAPDGSSPEQALVFRWDQLWARANGSDFQASLFTMAGVGYLLGDTHPDRSHLSLGLMGDAESQRLHASFALSRGVAPRLSPIDGLRLRAGFAPHLAKFSEPQAWLFLQANLDSVHGASAYRIGPVARVTWRNWLGELGALSRPAELASPSLFLAVETTF